MKTPWVTAGLVATLSLLFLWSQFSERGPESPLSAVQQNGIGSAPTIEMAGENTPESALIIRTDQASHESSRPQGIKGQVLQSIKRLPVSGNVELLIWDNEEREYVVLRFERSSADGHFEFYNLEDGKYELRVQPESLEGELRPSTGKWVPGKLSSPRPDYERTLVTLGRSGESRLVTVDLFVFQYGKIHGRVVGPDREPISGARVSAYSRIAPGKGGYSGRAVSGSDGEFIVEDCPPGWVEVSFALKGAGGNGQKMLLVEPVLPFIFKEGQMVYLGELRANAGDAKIVGRVVDQFGAPFVGLQVDCRQDGSSYGMALSSAITNQDGDFEIVGVPEGSFLVDLTANAYQVHGSARELGASFWEYPLKVNLDLSGKVADVGTHILQRPQLLEVSVRWSGEESWSKVKSHYQVDVSTVIDVKVESALNDAIGFGQGKVHAYDWSSAPPWFNGKSSLDQNPNSNELLNLTCLTPHAAIKVEVTNLSSGEAQQLFIRPQVKQKENYSFDGKSFKSVNNW